MELLENNNTLFSIIKGILISLIFTIVALTVFSLLLVYTNLSEQTIAPVIITITGISVLVGSSVSTRKLKRKGLINGAIIGGAYIIILYIISSIANNNFSINIMSIIMTFARNNRRNTSDGIIGVN